MPLFAHWETLTPTTSGRLFRDVLQGVPIEQAREEGTECPND